MLQNKSFLNYLPKKKKKNLISLCNKMMLIYIQKNKTVKNKQHTSINIVKSEFKKNFSFLIL